MVFRVRARSYHRALSWTVMVTLMIGLLGATTSAVTGSAECSAKAGDRLEGTMQHCQWMIPAVCCEEPLSVSSPKPVPKPSVSAAALLVPIHTLGTAPWTPEHASTASQCVHYATVVLRL
jgi:hypothetical protein